MILSDCCGALPWNAPDFSGSKITGFCSACLDGCVFTIEEDEKESIEGPEGQQ